MLIPLFVVAQGVAIGVGEPAPHASAILDLQSTTKGLLVPRMTTPQREDILDPADGLLVFDTSLGQFWYWQDDDWFPLAVEGEQSWSTFGNLGTHPWYNFIGTRDNADLRFRVNNEAAGRVEIPSKNTALGYLAFKENLPDPGNFTGILNTALGSEALRSNVDGSSNTAIGYRALSERNTGSRNTAIGGFSMWQTSGADNAAVGYNALNSNVSGTGHVAMGYEALGDLGGVGNTQLCVGIGRRAARFVQTADYCTFVGASAGSSNIVMTNSTYLGYQTANTASNQVRLGNTAVTSIGGQVGWTTLSDARFKRNVNEDVKGLDLIMRLRPVTYTVDVAALSAFLREDEDGQDEQGRALLAEARRDKEAVRYTGFLAQEVEQAAREAGYDFSGVDAPKNANDHYGLRYAEFVVPLVKAVQEQQASIERLERLLEQEHHARVELGRRLASTVQADQHHH